MGQRRGGSFSSVVALTDGERRRRRRGSHKFSWQSSWVLAAACSRGRQGEESPEAAVHGEVVGRRMAAHYRAAPVIGGEGEMVSHVRDMMELLGVETK
jgi:hypothetical protein